MKPLIGILLVFTFIGDFVASEPSVPDPTLQNFFQHQVEQIARQDASDLRDLKDWTSKKQEYRRQLQEMLGLYPWPERGELHATTTNTRVEDDIVVESLHFQSLPGLYVTANLYLPKDVQQPLPAILYVCGHARRKENGVSFGNKTAYQHHGIWFARHGYACLTIDTVQLGEIEGIHHGAYREGMWWWNSKGYTPAGVEAWNCIRALDYLETRAEVDASRFGVTGRSGGGAYSWWVTALDDRIRAAAPVAGITDLQNHVVDGVIEGHCDCMYFLNSYQWDFAKVAALAAPRPLLIANSDKDSIFPLDGVVRLHAAVRGLYQQYGAGENLGLLITEGPHKDTQDLRVPVFHWFNRHLKKEDPLIQSAAEPRFQPEELKVFDSIPEDQINTTIHESFVRAPDRFPVNPTSPMTTARRSQFIAILRDKVFPNWPANPPPLNLQERPLFSNDSGSLKRVEFQSERWVDLAMYVYTPRQPDPQAPMQLHILGNGKWKAWLENQSSAFNGDDGTRSNSPTAWMAPRGIDQSSWTSDEKEFTHIKRRFLLLGKTLNGAQAWDVRRAIQALRKSAGAANASIALQPADDLKIHAWLASVFEERASSPAPSVEALTSRQSPDFLNLARFVEFNSR